MVSQIAWKSAMMATTMTAMAVVRFVSSRTGTPATPKHLTIAVSVGTQPSGAMSRAMMAI
jgi:hypothetical protein